MEFECSIAPRNEKVAALVRSLVDEDELGNGAGHAEIVRSIRY